MKGSKRLITTILVLGSMMALLLSYPAAASAEEADDANRMNVVFVLDESGSMAKTDSEGLRYEAMDLFLGLSTESGNYMGAVVFDTDIILQEEIRQINGADSKRELSDSVRSAYSNGDTNIGKGIETATQMLEQQGNRELTSAVILLSDGNTDLKSQSAYEASEQSKINAIQTAQENGYPIYCICLNADGTADPAELEGIAAATGGTCVEVRNAEDLKTVFNQFYDMIYSTETVVLGDIVIPESGEESVSFQIPRIGVEEANIIISTLNLDTSYTLMRPDGNVYTEEELNSMRISAKTFSVIKIQTPQEGWWSLNVRGIPGDNVKVEMVYNADLSLRAVINGGDMEFTVETPVDVYAQLVDCGKIITDQTIYQDYPIYMVKEYSSGYIEESEMKAGEQGAEWILSVPSDGTVQVYFYCQIDNKRVESETFQISATNTAPKVLESPIYITRLVWPFSKEEICLEMQDYVTDAEDSRLSYRLVNPDLGDDAVYLVAENLYINIEKVGRGGEVSVRAEDSQGAVGYIRIIIKTIAILPILFAVIFIFVVLTAALLITRKIKENNKMIRGKVLIEPYTEDGHLTSSTSEGIRGKMYIGRCIINYENLGLDIKNTYFAAGDKNGRYIYLISKKGYYTEKNPEQKEKRIRLEGEMEVNISSDVEFTRGICVTYIPDDGEY